MSISTQTDKPTYKAVNNSSDLAVCGQNTMCDDSSGMPSVGHSHGQQDHVLNDESGLESQANWDTIVQQNGNTVINN